MPDIAIEINGMSCQHCVMRVKKALEALPGVTRVNVTVGRAEVGFDEALVQKKDIEDAIVRAGYKIKEQ